MPFVFLACGLAVFLGAVALAPPPPPPDPTARALDPPPTLELLRAAALAREDAAADILWLRTVQFIGAPYSESIHYEGLDRWVERVNDLSPAFSLPYFIGGI